MAATYACSRCNGKGIISAFSHVIGGTCFKCHGSGKQTTKPASKLPKFAVMGSYRLSGESARLYNVQAKDESAAVEKALKMFERASDAFKLEFTLDGATAVLAAARRSRAACNASRPLAGGR